MKKEVKEEVRVMLIRRAMMCRHAEFTYWLASANSRLVFLLHSIHVCSQVPTNQ